MCRCCTRMCCSHCHPAQSQDNTSVAMRPYFARINVEFGGWAPVCHQCTGARKYTAIPLQPPRPMDGLEWYFGAPYEETERDFDRKDRPCRWVNPNRDTSLDPMLLDIIEVHKMERLEDVTRQARPSGWETAFSVEAVLGGKDGSQATVRINLFAFVMNPAWRAHSVVKYIKDDWVVQQQNHEKIGKVLHPVLFPQAVPRGRASPKNRRRAYVVEESTVSIEELPDGDGDNEMAAMRAEVRRREAALPKEDDTAALDAEWEKLQPFLKRRRGEQ